ncbi:TldD/PmbA family protein [soil metagenome]
MTHSTSQSSNGHGSGQSNGHGTNSRGAELLALADRVVARAEPGEQVEAYVSRGGETEIRVYQGEVEHFVSAQSEGIGIRIIRGGRTGFAYAGTLDDTAVGEVLAEARDNLTFGTVDEWAGLAEPDGVAVTDQVLWNDELADFATDRKLELARELERLATSFDPRVRVDDSNYTDASGEAAVSTSTGIRTWGRENGCYVSVSTLADDGDETQSGFGFSVGRTPTEFDLEKAARDASDRATRLLGATKPASRRLTIVLDPMVTAQFLGVISATLNGEAVVKGRSLFRDRLGEEVAASGVTLVDDPTDPRAYTATEVDGEGLAARRNVLIDQGVLRQFTHASYSARRAGTTSTGNAVRGGFRGTPGVGALALQLVPGVRSQADIVADIDDGLLVQSVSGIHSGVNPISGDFSTGAAGLLISNGEVGAPVREFTIASTLQRMLNDVVEIGGDVDWLPMRAAGVSLVIRDVTMSGA